MIFRQIFGTRKKKDPAELDNALERLQNTMLLLIKRQKHLEEAIQKQLQTARKHGTKEKRMALRALRAKKAHEQELQRLDKTINAIEIQISNLKDASLNAEVLHVLKATSKTLQSSYKNMDADQIHGLMNDIVEQQELAAKITQAIGGSLTVPAVDEDNLMMDLKLLEQEEFHQAMLAVPQDTVRNLGFPDVPIDKLLRIQPSKEQAARLLQ